MIRLPLLACIAWIMATAPATRNAPSRPDLTALHRQAVDLMQQDKVAEARTRLDAVYQATPPQARSRALVINHAILDLGRPVYVMRGLRDLTSYLIAHGEEDELATNVLGSCLDVAASKPGMRRGAVWQAGFAEWQKRDAELEKAHGKHRWGAKWLSEEEYQQLQGRREASDQAIDAQQERARKAADAVEVALIRSEVRALIALPMMEREQRRTGSNAVGYAYHGEMLDTIFLPSSYAESRSTPGSRAFKVGTRSKDEKEATERAITDAELTLREELKRLDELLRKRPYPAWPTHYDPVDPSLPSTVPVAISATSQPAPPSLKGVQP
jgi:hypothetical protein